MKIINVRKSTHIIKNDVYNEYVNCSLSMRRSNLVLHVISDTLSVPLLSPCTSNYMCTFTTSMTEYINTLYRETQLSAQYTLECKYLFNEKIVGVSRVGTRCQIILLGDEECVCVIIWDCEEEAAQGWNVVEDFVFNSAHVHCCQNTCISSVVMLHDTEECVLSSADRGRNGGVSGAGNVYQLLLLGDNGCLLCAVIQDFSQWSGIFPDSSHVCCLVEEPNHRYQNVMSVLAAERNCDVTLRDG